MKAKQTRHASLLLDHLADLMRTKERDYFAIKRERFYLFGESFCRASLSPDIARAAIEREIQETEKKLKELGVEL